MIKLTITFEKSKKSENTTISTSFDDFKDISPWLDKIEILNDKKQLKNIPGFIQNIKEK